ncbi:MAG: glycoside hydrolase family 43 protein [Bacteroidales bacterium]
MKTYKVLFLLTLQTFINLDAQNNSDSPGTYSNPVGDSLIIADPSVIFHNQTYWAPEVIAYHGMFYMVFSCKGGDEDNTALRICLAVSDKPEGPFKDLYVPYFDNNQSCIDGHIFIDDNNDAYLFYEWVGVVGEPWNREGYFWGMIFGVPLKEDLSILENSEHRLCIYVDEEWEGTRSMYARSCEGMTVFKNRDTYYMTYSCNHYSDPNYGIGYATAKTPLGMWTKSPDNPILSRNVEKGVSGPGHNCIIQSPDKKETFIVYHSHADPGRPSGRRVLNIDRMVFDDQGNLSVLGPTRTPQAMPSGTLQKKTN